MSEVPREGDGRAGSWPSALSQQAAKCLERGKWRVHVPGGGGFGLGWRALA